MAIDPEDVEAVRAKQRESLERKGRLAKFEQMVESARPYERLVSDPAWNPYVNDLTGWMAKAQEQANVLAGQLTDPNKVLTADQVVALRIKIAALRAEADAYAKAIAIPTKMVAEKEKLEDDMTRELGGVHA